jgi:Protein of unknown function (DUF2934)
MAAPRKPKAAGVRTGKSKAEAAISGAAATPKVTTAPVTKMATAPMANGNGGGGTAPSAELIRLRAYEVFVARGGTAGDELSDWLTAEREMMEKFSPHD